MRFSSVRTGQLSVDINAKSFKKKGGSPPPGLRYTIVRMSDYRVPRVMGILNCTPDSFFAGSRRPESGDALKTALRMIRDGADIIDVGGESTRPGSGGVDSDEQIKRVVPVIRAIRSHSDISISIDTQSAVVAEAALDAGADIINDISALTADVSMTSLVAERGVPVVLMHMKGTPKNMQESPCYEDVVQEVREYLLRRVDAALAAGIAEAHIILDPGIGFGKRPEDNVLLLKHMDTVRIDGFDLLVGLSRKSFLGLIAEEEDKRAFESFGGPPIPEDGPRKSSPEDRSILTAAAHAWCLGKGVDILRVHDVQDTRKIIAVWEALSWAS